MNDGTVLGRNRRTGSSNATTSSAATGNDGTTRAMMARIDWNLLFITISGVCKVRDGGGMARITLCMPNNAVWMKHWHVRRLIRAEQSARISWLVETSASWYQLAQTSGPRPRRQKGADPMAATTSEIIGHLDITITF